MSRVEIKVNSMRNAGREIAREVVQSKCIKIHIEIRKVLCSWMRMSVRSLWTYYARREKPRERVSMGYIHRGLVLLAISTREHSFESANVFIQSDANGATRPCVYNASAFFSSAAVSSLHLNFSLLWTKNK